MNPKLLYLPTILTVVAGGIWLVSQQREIVAIERKNAQLLEKTGPARAATGSPARQKRPTWQQLTEKAKSGTLDNRALQQLAGDFQSMTAEQVVVALDEIGTMNLPEKTRSDLEWNLLIQLARKDPQQTLNRLGTPQENDAPTLQSVRSTAFKSFHQSDPAASMRWLDDQIAAGSFEAKALNGMNQVRIEFETLLVQKQFADDPAASETRIAVMSAEDARETLRRSATAIKPEQQAAFAEMVRGQLPEVEQLEIFARLSAERCEDLPSVSEYLNRISATPVERLACVKHTAQYRFEQLSLQKSVTPEQLDGVREWIRSQTPEASDRLTGEMLSNIEPSDGGLDFTALSKLAERYHQSSGSDDLLEAFLKSESAKFHPEEANRLAAKIRDPQRRAEILTQLNK